MQNLAILQAAQACPLDLDVRDERQIIQTITRWAMPWHLLSSNPITRALALPQSPVDVRRAVATELALRYGCYPNQVALVASNHKVLVVGFSTQGNVHMVQVDRDPLLPIYPWGGLGARERDTLDSGIVCLLNNRYDDARDHLQRLGQTLRDPLARWALAMDVAWCAIHL